MRSYTYKRDLFLVAGLILLSLPWDLFAQEVRYSYDKLGRVVGMVDEQGRTAIYEYDAAGNLLAIRRPDASGPLAITLVNPVRGAIGSQVQILGVGFSAIASQNQIAFNGVAAPVLAASTNSLVTQVPIGATSGPITLTTPLGLAVSPQNFTVTNISISPAQANVVEGTSRQFTATVTGTTDQRVIWSVNDVPGGSAFAGTINTDGLYIAPTIGAAPIIVAIQAASVAFPELSAVATVTVIKEPPQCNVNWTGGSSGLWQTSSNWSTKALPGATDGVCIGSGVTVTLSSGTQTIKSLQSEGNLIIAGGSLSIANASTIDGNFTLSGGTLTGSGTVTVSSVTTWTGGTMSGTGVTTLNGNVNISGNNFHDLSGGRTLNTTATTTISGGFNDFFRTSGGASINNSGLWQDQSAFNYGITGTQSTFRNTGIYRKSNGGGATTIGITFNNTSSGAGTGVVEVLAGTLSFTGGGTANSGSTFTGAAGATLRFGGGTYNLQTGSSINGATVSFGGGTTNINGTYSATTATSVSGGTANFNPGATVTSVGALTIGSGSGGTANFNTGGIIAPTALTLASIGTLAGTDAVTVSGLTTWTGGTMRGTGVTTLNGNVTITGNSIHDLFDGRTLNTTATTTISGGFNDFFRTSGGASINNSGLWQDQSAFNYGITGTQSTFRNTGIYRKSGGGGATTIGITFNNTSSSAGTGVVEILSGTLNFTGGGTANSGSTFTGAAGTTLRFGGGTYSLQTSSSGHCLPSAGQIQSLELI